MTCLDRKLATLNDIIAEGNKAGNLTPIGGLDEADTTAVLAAVAKNTDEGIGDYGLTEDKLIEAGVVKPGLNTSGTLEEKLSDPSVFTGCGGIRNVADVIFRQRDIVSDVANKTLNRLAAEGVITGDESKEEIARLAGMATKYSAKQIKDFKKVEEKNKTLLDQLGLDFISDIPLDKIAELAEIATLGVALFQNMGKIADAAKNAVAMIGAKAGALIDKVKGLGKSASKTPEKEKGTVKTAEVDNNVDKIVGSKRVPSSINPDEVAAAASSTQNNLVQQAAGLAGAGVPTLPPFRPGEVDVASLTDGVNKATGSLSTNDLFGTF